VGVLDADQAVLDGVWLRLIHRHYFDREEHVSNCVRDPANGQEIQVR
jgi:hypothetical protein